MLFTVEVEVARLVAVQQRAGGHHLRVKPRATRDQPMEVAAMPVSPIHHGRNAQSPVTEFLIYKSFF
jgi:hypothetical protein